MTSAFLPGLRAAGAPGAAHEVRLGELPLTVLVGVTGVGKSTALNALQSEHLKVLPDRREVTDAVMILPIAGKQVSDREVTDAVMILPIAGRSVSDREERFRLTAQYRDQHPGGMAQALGSLLADTHQWGETPVFDGLRGLDEVQYAAQHFPLWRFVALGAPDAVRVRRLLGRADGFDQVQADSTGGLRDSLSGLKGVNDVFSDVELSELVELVTAGYAPADILAKTKIVVSERRNYDPQAAEAFLRTLPRERALILDTLALKPGQVAQAVKEWA